MSKAQASASSFGALKEEYLLNRYIAGLQAENIKNRGLQILFNRMERMSDNMLLKTIRELSESGALEMAAIIGIPMPEENRISTMSIQQAFGLPWEGLQSSLGHRATSNPVKEIGQLLEAIGHRATSNPVKELGQLLEALEHIERYFSEHHIKPCTEGG